MMFWQLSRPLHFQVFLDFWSLDSEGTLIHDDIWNPFWVESSWTSKTLRGILTCTCRRVGKWSRCTDSGTHRPSRHCDVTRHPLNPLPLLPTGAPPPLLPPPPQGPPPPLPLQGPPLPLQGPPLLLQGPPPLPQARGPSCRLLCQWTIWRQGRPLQINEILKCISCS